MKIYAVVSAYKYSGKDKKIMSYNVDMFDGSARIRMIYANRRDAENMMKFVVGYSYKNPFDECVVYPFRDAHIEEIDVIE